VKLRVASAFVAAALVMAACGGSASPKPSPTLVEGRTPGAEDATRSFEISEVGLGDEGYVTIHNYTDVASSLDALFLCQHDQCVDLPDTVVEPDASARVAVGDGTGIDDVVETDAPLALTPANGEIALFATQDTDDSSAIRSYLQWGSTPHEMTDVAIKAGFWVVGGFAPSAPYATRLWKTDANLWVWDPGT